MEPVQQTFAAIVWDGEGIMPLECFSDEKREEIEWLASQDTPPPRWLNLGLAQIQSRAYYEWHIRRGRDPWRERRESTPRWLRERVIERDGLICQLCGGPVEPNDVHIDHIHPYSLGGRHTLSNLQVTHSLCNMRKGAKVLASS